MRVEGRVGGRFALRVAAAFSLTVLGCLPPLDTTESFTDIDPCEGKSRACGSQDGTCYACSSLDSYCGAGCTNNGTSFPWCCYGSPQQGYTTGITDGGGSVDPGTSCTGGNLQCSQPIGACGLQSCTCYYSGPQGDTCTAWYRVGTSYYPCAHCGPDYVNCDAAAQSATQACL